MSSLTVFSEVDFTLIAEVSPEIVARSSSQFNHIKNRYGYCL